MFTLSFNKKTIHTCTLTLSLALTPYLSHADECSMLKLQTSRSTGAKVVKTSCSDANALTLESQLELGPNSRLWLEAKTDDPLFANWQLICQNKSSSSITLQISQESSPWIKPLSELNCQPWTQDRLECSNSASGAKALMCAIAHVKKAGQIQKVEQTTSFTVRGIKPKTKPTSINPSSNREFEQWLANIKPEIDLCKKLYQNSNPVKLSWVVSATGQASETKIEEGQSDMQFGQCAKEVIENIKFPQFEKATQVTFTF